MSEPNDDQAFTVDDLVAAAMRDEENRLAAERAAAEEEANRLKAEEEARNAELTKTVAVLAGNTIRFIQAIVNNPDIAVDQKRELITNLGSGSPVPSSGTSSSDEVEDLKRQLADAKADKSGKLAGLNTKVTTLTEELAAKQQELAGVTNVYTAEKQQLETQVADLQGQLTTAQAGVQLTDQQRETLEKVKRGELVQKPTQAQVEILRLFDGYTASDKKFVDDVRALLRSRGHDYDYALGALKEVMSGNRRHLSDDQRELVKAWDEGHITQVLGTYVDDRARQSAFTSSTYRPSATVPPNPDDSSSGHAGTYPSRPQPRVGRSSGSLTGTPSQGSSSRSTRTPPTPTTPAPDSQPSGGFLGRFGKRIGVQTETHEPRQ